MVPAHSLPNWRSLLFCPVTSERFVAKVHLRGADVVILDLEDSIPASEKSRARTLVADASRIAGQADSEICVRINRPLELAVPDIVESVMPSVRALMIPKVLGPEHILLLSEVVASRELELGMPVGTTQFIAMIETASSLTRLESIARAHPRVVALGVGSEDLATDLGAVPSADSMYVPKVLGIIAARAAGVLPLGLLGSVSMAFGVDEYRARARRSRELGLACAACIHPDQVAIINAEFSPRPEELIRAEMVVAAFEAAVEQGRGAAILDGEMIDLPVAERARRLIADQLLHSGLGIGGK
jgi:citrate lyase subunit beta/citryl-CoA lyase